MKYTGDEINNISFLTNLKDIKPENAYTAKKGHMRTTLTDEQIRKFVKYNNLDSKLIEAFLKFKLSVTGQDVADRFGISSGPEMGDAIKKWEQENFEKLL